MITIDFSTRGTDTLCDYLYSSIKKQILDGELPASSKLPSKRALASHLGISIITVQNAYAQLISEGYIFSIEKKGFYVSDFSIELSKNNSQSQIKNSIQKSTNPEVKFFTDFTSNSTSVEKFPFTLWAHLTRQILNTSDEKLLQRYDVKGTPELREAIADYLQAFRNMNVSPEQIIIGAGTESLYSMLVLYLGRDKIYAVENPGYHKVREILELNGASCIPVKMDKEGLSPEALNENNIQIVYSSPNHHFPTGTVMPVKRRIDLLGWLNEDSNRYVIEDDYDSEFRFKGKPLPTLQSLNPKGNIIYMNTFTKTLSPSFRISYMVLPEHLISDFQSKLKSYSCQVSAFEQFILAKFIKEGYYETHINRMRNYYRSIRNSLIGDFQKSKLMSISEIAEEEAGLHFLLTINVQKDPKQVQELLNKNGINIALLSDYYYSSYEDRKCTFVVNYSALKRENISETVTRIEKAIMG